ncbi:uncharacterized protein SPSC_06193 [Sporisorium scitamineum]|uniref:F-box domain-containing protein n=1 Tax=Sporisorium scitamineum TaxID=49012 RepID=A0A127ZJB0_9BASI|nr:uncharacterized protein SPSC_06193 [Sporisorium scitamineum]
MEGSATPYHTINETLRPPHSESSSNIRPSDLLEERLADAEKEVAIAFQTLAYDELILAATEALKYQPQTPIKTVIKSRKNLLWARAHAYHNQNLHELALKDARAALKLDPDDIAAYIRAAVLLSNTGHKEQAFSCLDTAHSLASKYEIASRALWMRRIDKQRRKVSGLSWRIIDRLPNEILIEVASHLNVANRNSMSQTCRLWRRVLISAPSLWTSLTIVMEGNYMTSSKVVEWMRYINMRSERANHCLEHVVFKGSFPAMVLRTVCSILRLSAASLKHIEIPTSEEWSCYDLLYRHCPRLTSLVFEPGTMVHLPDFSFSECPDFPAFKETKTVEPFSLESIHVSRRSRIGRFMDKHLHKAHTVIGYNPFLAFEFGTFEETQMDFSLAEHLVEWELADSIAYERRTALPLSVTFPKLTKLSNLDPKYGSQLKLAFPNLVDLQYDPNSTLPHTFDNLVHILTTSPKLRRLSFMSGELWVRHQDVREALLNLHHLEELDMAAMYTQEQDLINEYLVPRAVSSESGQTEVLVPLPKLRILALDASSRSQLNKLTISLSVREQLRQGENLTTAKHLAANRVHALPRSPAPAVSPFQRGTTSAGSSESSEELQGPRLKDSSDCARLQCVKLTGIVAIPNRIETVLNSVTDKLIIQYDPL